MTVRFNAGPQHMTGERALQYARSRHSLEDGTDFGRSPAASSASCWL